MPAVPTVWSEERTRAVSEYAQVHGLDAAAEAYECSRDAIRGACNRARLPYRQRRPAPAPAPAKAGVALGNDGTGPAVLASGAELNESLDVPPPRWEPPPPPVIPVGRDLSFSLLGDLHAPEHDHPAWDACLRWHADAQPDVIVCSEMGEWGSVTKYGGNWGQMFEEDVKATRRVFVQLRSVCPDSRIVVLEANHDTRLARRIAEQLPQLAGRLVIPQELKLADMGIEWVPETVSFRLGRMKMIHGHQLAGAGKVQALPENACKRAIERYGEAGWIVVFWHTHRRGYWGIRRDTGTLEAINLPCLRTLAPDWTKPNPTGWSLGFAGGYVDASGRTDLYPINIEHGAFKWAGKRYAAAA